MPQSTSSRLPAASTRYFEPVTLPAAPRKVSFAIGSYSKPTSCTHNSLGGSRIEVMHVKQQPVVMRVIGLLFLSVISLAMSSVSRPSSRVVHVFVALADNQHQGIIPVPPALGNGQDPQRNLYWGAAYGVKTYFRASQDWEPVWSGRGPKNAILERCVFKNSKNDVYLVADAYEGSQIKMAVTDFLSAAAGVAKETVSFKIRSVEVSFAAAGDADVIVYV